MKGIVQNRRRYHHVPGFAHKYLTGYRKGLAPYYRVLEAGLSPETVSGDLGVQIFREFSVLLRILRLG